MAEKTYDLIVIGAGPGGYVAAIRAAQLGMSVACVEKSSLGGTCLNIGCIPSKALLDSSERYFQLRHGIDKHGIRVGNIELDLATMMGRKDAVVRQLTTGVGFLFKKNKIDHIHGTARIVSPGRVEVTADSGRTQHSAKRIIIATGSSPIQIPALPFDEKNIVSSTGAIALSEVPRRMIVVGGGYIGLELGSVWARLGSDVLVLEFLDRILPPSDREMTGQLQKLLEKQGLKFRFRTAAQSAEVKGGKVRVAWKSAEGSESGTEEVDKVLVAVGRRPVTEGLGLKELGVTMDAKGFVQVGKSFETNVEGVYAIGDVIGGVMLAHKAEEEAVACVDMMSGRHGHVNYHAIPSVVYTHPELAQVGFTEEDARAAGHELKIGKFPMMPNGRAKAMGETDGLVKVIGDAKTDKLLGVHILAAHASDMIHEAQIAMEFSASVEDLGRAIHAHPTLPEALKEAALAADKRAIHA